MPGRTVQLRVGGQTYRVVTTASEEELQRLAAVVDQKLAAVVPPGRAITPQAMLLAAMALAHDLEEERARAAAVTARARAAFGRMLERVDAALGEQSRLAEVTLPLSPAKPTAPVHDGAPLGEAPKPPPAMGAPPKPPALLTFTGRPRPANEP
jgi:cell division protein ZapA